MNEQAADMHRKIGPTHLKRDAYLYVRQSTMRQVLENTESTKRQYQLRERALALGWSSEQIRVIDRDQGCSGATEAGRDGFQELIAEVSLGNAGLVMGLEVSRLARNNADWHRLLELCAFTETLILDQDGLYDPSTFNDRLLLGLKGTMSEAELHVLRSRLQQGILNKARRGELKISLPAGLEYDELDRVVLSSNTQVRETMQRFFEAFERLGAASAVLKEFRRDGILMPHYSHVGPKSSRIIWADLTHSQALRILHNPRYAGAFAFGKVRSRKGPDGRMRYRKAARDAWVALIPDSHEGYISWDQFESNQRRLAENANAYKKDELRGPAREGPALLQGLAVCGVCGKRMTLRYHRRGGELIPDYMCQRDAIEDGRTPVCQRLPGADIDKAVAEVCVEAMSASNVEVALAVQDELKNRVDESDRLRAREVERRRYDADLAKRRYLRVDPDQRYVAEILEAEWNEKLRELEEAQTEYERARERDRLVVDEEARQTLRALERDFAHVWTSTALPNRERKRMVRLLVEDVTLLRTEAVTAHIRFKGGATRTLELAAPQTAWEKYRTDPQVVQLIDRLMDEHTDAQIVTILNEQGCRTGKDRLFSSHAVARVRACYNLRSRRSRLRDRGLVTAAEVAEMLGITHLEAACWRRRGMLQGEPMNDKNECLYHPPTEQQIAAIKSRIAARNNAGH